MRKRIPISIIAVLIAVLVISTSLFVLPKSMNLNNLTLNKQYLTIRDNAISNGTPQNLSGIEISYFSNVSVNGIGNFEFALLPAFGPNPGSIYNKSLQNGSIPLFMPAPIVNLILLNESSPNSYETLEFNIVNISLSSHNYLVKNVTTPYHSISTTYGGIYSHYIGPSYFLSAHMSGPVLIYNLPDGVYYLHVTLGLYKNVLGFPIFVKNVGFSIPFITVMS